jgi:hypothetical protein
MSVGRDEAAHDARPAIPGSTAADLVALLADQARRRRDAQAHLELARTVQAAADPERVPALIASLAGSLLRLDLASTAGEEGAP